MASLNGSDLRTKLPASRTRAFTRVAPFDVIWAGICPILAFLIRDGTINRIEIVELVAYDGVALVISLIVFQWFRISSPIPNYFSLHDAFTVFKACLITVALTAVVLFISTRLDFAPRSIPIIHFLVLGCGLIGVRALSRFYDTRRPVEMSRPGSDKLENILVIGATRLAWFFSKMVDEFSSHERRIVAVVDERRQLIGRSLNGYSIVGTPENLSSIIDEYAIHGIEINKVVVAAYPKYLTDKVRKIVRSVCKTRNIPIEWLHETFALRHAKTTKSFESFVVGSDFAKSVTARLYWKAKRMGDIVIALAMMITFAPLTILVAALVMIDVGFPIVFWQQRVGYLGRPFHVYKFRTLRSPFDRNGRLIPESERLSLLGWILRTTHLDEIPQLFNILLGDMSLIGPRPLLPVDQPKNIRFRLQVRPGLTGLAQINGGTLLSPDEKDALDTWYVQHASLFLDIKIMLRTMWVIVHGNHRNNTQISSALAEKRMNSKYALE